MSSAALARTIVYANGLRRCWYCGTLTKRPVACQGHADLPPLDPYLTLARR